MTISLSDAGKRYNRDWIFRHIQYIFEPGQSYAITGANGSGKSTLLQVLSGSMMLNEGKIHYSETRKAANQKSAIPSENVFRYVSLCAPYMELIEEMTLVEFLNFHEGFKAWLPGMNVSSIVDAIGLDRALQKQIRYYSSGMKQRVKLAQCIFSNTDIVLLDEPCTNLDSAGIDLYHRLIDTYCKERTVIVSSNDEVEYKFCKQRLNIGDYK